MKESCYFIALEYASPKEMFTILSDGSRPIVERALSGEVEQHGVDSLAAVMTRNNASFDSDYDVVVAMLGELRTGILESGKGGQIPASRYVD